MRGGGGGGGGRIYGHVSSEFSCTTNYLHTISHKLINLSDIVV